MTEKKKTIHGFPNTTLLKGRKAPFPVLPPILFLLSTPPRSGSQGTFYAFFERSHHPFLILLSNRALVFLPVLWDTAAYVFVVLSSSFSVWEGVALNGIKTTSSPPLLLYFGYNNKNKDTTRNTWSLKPIHHSQFPSCHFNIPSFA